MFSKFERKNGYFEARTGNRCDKSAKGEDVLAVLPTGFGKSMIFTVFALSARELNRPVCVLVIYLLKSIMLDQVYTRQPNINP